MSRKFLIALVGGGVMVLIATVAMAVWFYRAPHRTVDRIHAALKQTDTNSLARDIDFPVVQASLNEQITFIVTNRMAADAAGQPVSPIAAAVAGGIVKFLVAQNITPAGLCNLLTGQAALGAKKEKARTPDYAELYHAFAEADRGYRSSSQFVVTMTGRKGETTHLVLSRDGLRWKLVNIVLPLEQ